MFPELHAEVSTRLEEDGLSFDFHTADTARNSTEVYDTNIMGDFVCSNDDCASNGWSSKKIAITIRMYPGKQYNARVYYQRCRSCRQLSKPTLDTSYAERVAYRLKKWSGLQLDIPYYSNESKGPHQSWLCEGCKNGHCSAQD